MKSLKNLFVQDDFMSVYGHDTRTYVIKKAQSILDQFIEVHVYYISGLLYLRILSESRGLNMKSQI